MKNHDLITQGFNTLRGVLSPIVVSELRAEYGENWWTESVMSKLHDDQKRGLPSNGSDQEITAALDIEKCLLLIEIFWREAFRKKLSKDHRAWCNELKGVRNRCAHVGANDFNESDTYRALDTMVRICESLDFEATETLRSLLRESRYGTAGGSVSADAVVAPAQPAKNAGVLQSVTMNGLKSWRNVMLPHPDVAQGRYKNAEFAADLAQVARGEGAIEYKDPVEFFGRTYITAGMMGLLVQSLKRVAGLDGEPVIQLKTAFGGGKTHSMLALYHLLKGGFPLEKVPSVVPVLTDAGIADLPKVNVAVIVGTALDPSKSKRLPQLPGITVNTLWGEIAAQLAISAHDPKIYDFVKDADKKSVSPGSAALTQMLDACGPCLILIDELVAYAKKIYGVSDLPAGSFDNIITFVQEITEAARASKNSLVVASIPESDIEIGGTAGQETLKAIEHTFGRMEAIWKPVAADEGFEIVRRRLFLTCRDETARDAVCDAYSALYYENSSNFPPETRELDYRRRLEKCYPIHPEVFDRLYEDWATLERFQRTRGVLRLMAAVIHNLWMNNDAGLMIMPGSIALDSANVRDELTRHLPDAWNAIVDAEVDGKSSIPYTKDRADSRYGNALACRRVARTIMLGSAPTNNAQNVRGIEYARIMLGVVQPGENVSVFRDALSTLRQSLTYLYSDSADSRFWFDTRPILKKTAADRMQQQTDDDVMHEIISRLRKARTETPFAGVHICPASSLDVPNEQSCRLVVLNPNDYYAQNKSNPAETAALDILKNRGTSPRSYRNMLVFVATEENLLNVLKSAVKEFLAWKSIGNDADTLNLDRAQTNEVKSNIERFSNNVQIKTREAFSYLLISFVDPNVDLQNIEWDVVRLQGNDEIPHKAAVKVLQNEDVITNWNPSLLLMKMNELLWKDADSISVKQLWDYLTRYCYLPRLADYNVLQNVILKGVRSTEYFGLADGETNGAFLNLKIGEPVADFDKNAVLVKADIALALQKEKIKPEETIIHQNEINVSGETAETVSGQTLSEQKDCNFIMSAVLDPTRIIRAVQNLNENVIAHLQQVEKSQVNISLEVTVHADNGFSPETIRTVSENCKTLKISDFQFKK